MARTGATPINFGSPNKNYLINADMFFLQINTLVSNTITATKSLKVQDRWLTSVNNVGFFTSAVHGPTQVIHPVTGETVDAINFSSNASSPSAEGQITQRVESVNSKWLAGKNASLSFLVRNDNFSTVGLRLYYANTVDNFSAKTLFHTATPQVLTISSTVKVVKFEDIPIPASAVNGLEVEIYYAGFSVGVASNTALARAMFNEGSFANPFELYSGKDHTAEENACFRYLVVTTVAGTGLVQRYVYEFPTRMRTSIPIITEVAGDLGVVSSIATTSSLNMSLNLAANDNAVVLVVNGEL